MNLWLGSQRSGLNTLRLLYADKNASPSMSSSSSVAPKISDETRATTVAVNNVRSSLLKILLQSSPPSPGRVGLDVECFVGLSCIHTCIPDVSERKEQIGSVYEG